MTAPGTRRATPPASRSRDARERSCAGPCAIGLDPGGRDRCCWPASCSRSGSRTRCRPAPRGLDVGAAGCVGLLPAPDRATQRSVRPADRAPDARSRWPACWSRPRSRRPAGRLGGFTMLPVAVPLFLAWTTPLRTAWLVAYRDPRRSSRSRPGSATSTRRNGSTSRRTWSIGRRDRLGRRRAARAPARPLAGPGDRAPAPQPRAPGRRHDRCPDRTRQPAPAARPISLWLSTARPGGLGTCAFVMLDHAADRPQLEPVVDRSPGSPTSITSATGRRPTSSG